MDDIYGYQNGNHRQAIISLIAAGALLLVILFLVLWLVFWHHPAKKSVSTNKGTQTSQEAKPEQSKSSDTGVSTTTGDETAANGSSSTSGTSPSPSSNSGSSTTQLPSDATDSDGKLDSTGPGAVYVLFAVSVVAGTAFRHRQLSRRG